MLTKKQLESDSITFRCNASVKKQIKEFAEDVDGGMTAVLTEGAKLLMEGTLPLLGDIPCGPLAEAITASPYSEVVSPSLLHPRPGDFLLEASGSSNEPEIYPGDLLHCRPGVEHGNGEFCAVHVYDNEEHEGEPRCAFKRVFVDMERGVVTLKSTNPAYPPVEVPARRVKIVAVYRGLIRGAQRTAPHGQA